MPNRAVFTYSEADFAALYKKMDELKAVGGRGATGIIERQVKNTVGRMKKDAPVDTGNLRSRIDYEKAGKVFTIESEARDPETGINYAPIQEFGAPGIRNTPFFYGNIRLFIRDTHRALGAAIRKIIISKYRKVMGTRKN